MDVCQLMLIPIGLKWIMSTSNTVSCCWKHSFHNRSRPFIYAMRLFCGLKIKWNQGIIEINNLCLFSCDYSNSMRWSTDISCRSYTSLGSTHDVRVGSRSSVLVGKTSSSLGPFPLFCPCPLIVCPKYVLSTSWQSAINPAIFYQLLLQCCIH